MTIRNHYVAGAYTADTRTRTLHNIILAQLAGIALARAGKHPVVPHVSGSHRRNWEEAMRPCRETIQSLDPDLDCVVLMDGWEHSMGAREERDLALSLGVKVLTIADALGEASHVHPI